MGTSPTGALLRSVGARVALGCAWDLAIRRGGRPFAALPPAEDRRERLSRQQAEPAILLYRALLRRLPPADALSAATEVITAGAVQHLGRTLGDLDPQAFAKLAPDARNQRVAGWLERFFTTTARLDETTSEEVRFTVTACALNRLVRAAGHPELAPAFCKGDAAFFRTRNPPVELERSETLAEGGGSCPFRLRLAGGDSQGVPSPASPPSGIPESPGS